MYWIKGFDFFWYDEVVWFQCFVIMNEDQGKDYNLDVNRVLFVSLVFVIVILIEFMFEWFFNWCKFKKFEGWMLRFKNNL